MSNTSKSEVKTLDISKKEFMANGVKYLVTEKISIGRYAEYQKLMPLLTYGVNFEEMNKQLRLAYNYLDKQKLADSAVIIHNLMSNVKNVESHTRIHPALKMAAMFINRENENLAVFDEQLTNQKIEDWTLEGYSISDFFSLSLNSIKGFREAYEEFIKKSEEISS